jgi:NAD(P)-dependent dehydrogenase (short-subunit alcohol dehydrogenase family)
MLLQGKSVVVTGGNSGIGEAIVLAAAAEGANVVVDYVAHPEETTALIAKVEAAGGRAVGVQADVSQAADLHRMVQTAVDTYGRLDVLINNAGIEERGEHNVVIGPADVTADLMQQTFETNVFGTVRVTHAFLPLLQRSAAPVVVNVSSGLASLTEMAKLGTPRSAYPGVAYPASKAAVNMITVQYAKAFPDMRINAVEPGFTKTDLNGNTGIQTVQQGAQIIVRMAQAGHDGPTGGYFDARGSIPW